VALSVREILTAVLVSFVKIKNVLKLQTHVILILVDLVLFAHLKAFLDLLANVLLDPLEIPKCLVLRVNANVMKNALIKRHVKITTASIHAKSKLAKRTYSVKLFVTCQFVEGNSCQCLKSQERHLSLESPTSLAPSRLLQEELKTTTSSLEAGILEVTVMLYQAEAPPVDLLGVDLQSLVLHTADADI